VRWTFFVWLIFSTKSGAAEGTIETPSTNGGQSVRFLNCRNLPQTPTGSFLGAIVSEFLPIMSNWWQISDVNAVADAARVLKFHGLMSTKKAHPAPPFGSPLNLGRQLPAVCR
jgi:hypothetical protein